MTATITAPRTWTHPDVFAAAARGETWADPQTDPTRIDWPARQAAALIPFAVVDGRPVSPLAPTGIRYGRGELGHWGEQAAADALVTTRDPQGARWIVMVERADGHGWALPGGYVDPGETPADAAIRELHEETGLALDGVEWRPGTPRPVPDPRGTDESWMVAVLATADLGTLPADAFPAPVGADDATRADWVRADTFATLAADLTDRFGGTVFPAHTAMLREVLDGL